MPKLHPTGEMLEDEIKKKELACIVAGLCLCGMMAMIVAAGLRTTIWPFNTAPAPVARTEVVTGEVESYYAHGYSVSIFLKDQPGPHRPWVWKNDDYVRCDKLGWDLRCNTVPSFVVGEKYTFTYRGGRLLSCYKVK